MTRIFIWTALLCAAVLSAPAAPAADYYIDPAGSDASDGTSPETAWQTFDNINTPGRIQPGDRVLFKRGGLWRGHIDAPSGTKDKPIYYGPYGEGEKPTIYCSVDLTDPDDWIAPEQGSSIWKTRRHEKLRLGSDIGNIILTPKGQLDKNADRTDDSRRRAAFKRWKKEDLTENDDFWYDKDTEQIWYYSDINPAMKYDECEAALHYYAIIAHEYQIFEDLAIGYAGMHGIAGFHSKGCVIRGCDIFWIGGGEIGGFSAPTRFGNGIEFWEFGEDHLVENCRVWQVYDVAFSIQGPEATDYRNIVWRNNTVWDCEQSFEVWLTSPESQINDCVFEYNRCYDAGFGWSHVQRPDKNGTHLLSYSMDAKSIDFKFRHNIFSHARNGLTRFYNDRIAEFDIDENFWWQPEEEGVAGVDQEMFLWALGRKKEQGGAVHVSYRRYREMTGNDEHSLFAEPPALNKGPIAPLEETNDNNR